MPVAATTLSQSKAVAAATRQTMELAKKLDTNGDKKLDEGEVKALMADIDTFTNGGGPAAQGALPAEKTRMQMAIMQSLTKMGEDPRFKDADTVKLSDLRISMKKTINELVTTAKKLDDDGGLMGGLGGLLSLTMLPDVAVKHVQEHLLAHKDD